jgi:hypothetical protein
MPLQGIEKIEDNEGSNPSLSANNAKGPTRGLSHYQGQGGLMRTLRFDQERRSRDAGRR